MTDIELINYVIANDIASDLKVTETQISFFISNEKGGVFSERNEQIPCEEIIELKNSTQRDFTISSGYNSLHLKFNRIYEPKS